MNTVYDAGFFENSVLNGVVVSASFFPIITQGIVCSA